MIKKVKVFGEAITWKWDEPAKDRRIKFPFNVLCLKQMSGLGEMYQGGLFFTQVSN
jgi:hypothetical protein